MLLTSQGLSCGVLLTGLLPKIFFLTLCDLPIAFFVDLTILAEFTLSQKHLTRSFSTCNFYHCFQSTSYPHCRNLGLIGPFSYSLIPRYKVAWTVWSRTGKEILGFYGTRSFFALFTQSPFLTSPLSTQAYSNDFWRVWDTNSVLLAGTDWSRAMTATMSSMCCAMGTSGRHIYSPTCWHQTTTAWKCSKIQRRGKRKCCRSYASRRASLTTPQYL